MLTDTHIRPFNPLRSILFSASYRKVNIKFKVCKVALNFVNVLTSVPNRYFFGMNSFCWHYIFLETLHISLQIWRALYVALTKAKPYEFLKYVIWENDDFYILGDKNFSSVPSIL